MPFLEKSKVTVKKKVSHTEGRFLILEVEITCENFVFINLFNLNTESKQIKTFEKLFSHIKLLNLDDRSQIACVGYFNLFFNLHLEAYGGNPRFKSKSVVKFHDISKTLDLYHIWQVRNRDKRLDYVFISNNLQESIVKAEVLESFLSDHSSVAIKIRLCKELKRGLRKFYKFLLKDENFVKKIYEIYMLKSLKLKAENALDEQIKWNFLKYEICKFCIAFCKSLQKKKNNKKSMN